MFDGYEIYLTNDRGARIAAFDTSAIIDNVLEFTASKTADGVGGLAMRMPVTFDPRLLRRDVMVQIWRAPRGGSLDFWQAYFIRYWRFSLDNGSLFVDVEGFDPKHLLTRRIVANYAGTAGATFPTGLEVTINTSETLGTAFTSGALYTANSNAIPDVGLRYIVDGTGSPPIDFTGNEMTIAKGGNATIDDIFEVTDKIDFDAQTAAEGIGTAMTSGSLYTENGNAIPSVNDYYVLEGGSNDFTGSIMAGVKGAAIATGDLYKIRQVPDFSVQTVAGQSILQSFQSAACFLANGNEAVEIGDIYVLEAGSADFTGGEMAAAKGGAIAAGDIYVMINGLPDVAYLDPSTAPEDWLDYIAPGGETAGIFLNYIGAIGAGVSGLIENTDDIMKGIVDFALSDDGSPATEEGSRALGRLTVQSNQTLGPTTPTSVPWRQVLTLANGGALPALQRASREAGNEVFYDVEVAGISPSSISFEFRTRIRQPGLDRTTLIFSEELNNLSEPFLEFDYRNERNYIYSGGPGLGLGRTVRQVADSARYKASIWNRCEGWADARQQNTPDSIDNTGKQKLIEGRPKLRFGGIPLDTANARFGIDWDWGYRVTARFLDYEFEAIIRAVALSVKGSEEQVQARLEAENDITL
jgi:hypothetical protein